MRSIPLEKKKKKKKKKSKIWKKIIFFLFFKQFFHQKKEEEKSRRPQKRKRAGTLNMFLFFSSPKELRNYGTIGQSEKRGLGNYKTKLMG